MQSSQDHFQVHNSEMNWSDYYFAFGIHIILINVTIILRCRLYHLISRIYVSEDDKTRVITKKWLRGNPALEPHFSYARIRSIIGTPAVLTLDNSD